MPPESLVDIREQSATDLLNAYGTGVPIAPLSEAYPELTVDDAYAIQHLQMEHWITGGARVVGWKVGLTARAMQRQLGVDRPDAGVLRDDMYVTGEDPVQLDRFIAPRIEPELAFVIGGELSGPGVTLASAARAVDFVIPALEIIDSRIADWRITIVDTVADNASSGAFVLGDSVTPLHRVELPVVGCNLHRNGELQRTGAGGAVLGSPLAALVWLANQLGRRGLGLHPGDAVLAGSLTSACALRPGETWSATFAGMGTVTLHTAREES